MQELGEHPLIDLDHSVPVLATILSNRIASTGSAMFRKRHGLGSMEWKVMSVLATCEGQTGAHISQLIGLDRAAVSRVVKEFVSRGIVYIGRNARQSNYQALFLTEAGKELHNQAIQTAFERERALLESFSEEERRQIIDLLRRLIVASGQLFDN